MDFNSGAYSDRYKIVEREQIISIKNASERDNLARGKKLSQENYRRRRAIAIKRKLEAQKEEKRRQQILAQRREKQREATERFQRRNKSYKGSVTPDSGQYQDYHDDDNPAPALDEALRAIRGSPVHRQTSIDSQGSHSHIRAFSPSTYTPYTSTPGYNSKSDKYAYLSPSQLHSQQQRTKEHATQVAAYTEMQNRNLRNLNSSRGLFEQHLHQQQQLLVQQQEQSLHDFNTAIMQEMLNDKKIEGEENDHEDHIETDSVSSEDSLNRSQDITLRTNDAQNSEPVVTNQNDSFRLTHDDSNFSLGRNGKNAQRTFNLEDRGYPLPGSTINGVSAPLVQSETVFHVVSGNGDQNGHVSDADGTATEPSQEHNPAIYRTSAFQIHNKAWINSDQAQDSNSNVLTSTSNSKPNSLRTTLTNATATHSVARKGEFIVTSSPPQMMQSQPQSFSTAQTTNKQMNTVPRSVAPQVSPSSTGTSKYSVVQNVSSTNSVSQLRQPTVYSRIATKDSVKQGTNVPYYNVPNSGDRVEEEIQDDVSSINSLMSNTKGPEPELKVVRSILKKTNGPIPVMGIMGKKSSGYGAVSAQRTVMQNPIVRDSLEINKKQIEEKHERQERKKSTKKKGVRFADLTYDDDSSSESGDEQPKETIYEIEKEEVKPVVNNQTPKPKERHLASVTTVSHKPPRPISARVAASPKAVEKASRVSSAPVTRRSVQQGRIIQQNLEQNQGQNGQGPPVRRTAFGESPSPSISGPLVRKNGTENLRAYNGNDNTSRPTEANRQYGYPNTNRNNDVKSQNGVPERGQEVVDMNGVPLDKTPTDAEINWLWDKVRTCLNRESSSISEVSPRPPSGKLYIDGNTLGPNQRHATRVASSPTGQNKVYNNPSESINSLKRRAALLQARNKQQQPNTLKSYKTNETPPAGYTTTVQYPSSSSQGPGHANAAQTQEMSESMAAFLTAEMLSEKNVSDSQIHNAMDSAQKTRQPVKSHSSAPKVSEFTMEWNGKSWVKTKRNGRLGTVDGAHNTGVGHRVEQVLGGEPTMLSLEEQRLMQSLERLNERLRITEVSGSPTNVNHPNVFSPKTNVPSGFKGHQPLSSHNRRSSADGSRNIRFRTGSGTGINRTNYGRQY